MQSIGCVMWFWVILIITYWVEGEFLQAKLVVRGMDHCDALLRSELLESIRIEHPQANATCVETDVVIVRPRMRPEVIG